MRPKPCLIALFLFFIHVAAGKKNILFLAADDMRPNLGAYQNANKNLFKYPPMHTPNLDGLADESLMFLNAFVQQALCSPSRTSLLTGRRPDTTRITVIGPYWRDMGGNFTTIPQFFKEQGYRTLGGGKIFHGGSASGDDDIEFSWTDPYHHAKNPYPSDKSVIWKAISAEETSEKPCRDTQEADYIIERLREVAPTAKYNETPFFVAFGVHKPHMPWFFPEEYLQFYPEENVHMPYNPNCPIDMPDIAWNKPPIINYDDCSAEAMGIPDLGEMNVTWPNWKQKELRRAYYSAISFVDYELGRVLNEIKNLGLEEDTIIVFWGDHGWQLGEHAEWAKQTVFDIANRVPFMMKIPGITEHGLQTSKLVELIDIFPTLVEAAGFNPLDACPKKSNDIEICSEGSSLLPLFEDQDRTDWKDAVFWQYPRGKTRDDNLPTEMGYTIRTEGYRYTEWVTIKFLGGLDYEPDWENPADHEELYDLEIDPQENLNRYNDPEYFEVKEMLSEKLRAGWKETIY